MKRSSRKASKLSESLQRHLNAYALAASAAGVGLLVFVQPADAEIVYTKVHDVIRANSKLWIDLNHDGKWDFVLIEQDCKAFSCGYDNSLDIQWRSWPAGVEGRGIEYIRVASALNKGQFIGPKKNFLPRGSGDVFMAAHLCGYLSCVTTGPWINVKDRYLGLKFQIGGRARYGWARVSVTYSKQDDKISGVLTGYAYET